MKPPRYDEQPVHELIESGTTTRVNMSDERALEGVVERCAALERKLAHERAMKRDIGIIAYLAALAWALTVFGIFLRWW